MDVFRSCVWFFTNAYELQKTQIKTNKIFTHTFLNIDESRNLTILKYISRSNPNMPLSQFKYDDDGKVDFKHAQIWLWVCLSKEKLI
jgi:hypothetical protein